MGRTPSPFVCTLNVFVNIVRTFVRSQTYAFMPIFERIKCTKMKSFASIRLEVREFARHIAFNVHKVRTKVVQIDLVCDEWWRVTTPHAHS